VHRRVEDAAAPRACATVPASVLARRLAALLLSVVAVSPSGCKQSRPEAGDRTAEGASSSASVEAGSATADAAATRDPAVAAGSSGDAGAAPARLPAAEYVGSARCGKCHRKQREAWRQSWHARALARPERRAVRGDFAGAHYAGSSSEAWMKRRGSTFVMRTRGPGGELADFPVDWLIGGKRMQDDVTILSDGRWQVLPVYYHVTGREWVDYTEKKQGPLDPQHPFYWTNFRRMANHECLDCHTTGLRVDYDLRAARWTTRFADAGVGCESCHGPGSRHADTTETADIFHPGKAPRDLALAACGQCHGPRNPVFPLLDADHHFRPGQRYDDAYDPNVVLIADRQSEDFFADGRPKSSSFEYQALIQSACHRRGGATCLSCHGAPHATRAPAELRASDPDAGCRGCHAPVFAAGRSHTHHRGRAARCVACHMPPVVSGVLDRFADHAIDVPVPENTARHGVPSACGECHADRTPAQLARSLVAWWPGAARRQARRLRLADAFDHRTAESSARALAEVAADPDEAPTLRGAAVVLLARRFGPVAAAAARPLLDSDDPLLRGKACEAIGAARATEAADAVAGRLDDPSLRVRLAAAMALEAMGDARGAPALARLAAAPESQHLLQPHLIRGPSLARRGDMDGARTELEWVARLTPYYADALVQLAHVAARQGDLAAARTRVAQALQLDSHHSGALALKQSL
jgi:HEAT repeats/Cytochrome c554 and c-prime